MLSLQGEKGAYAPQAHLARNEGFCERLEQRDNGSAAGTQLAMPRQYQLYQFVHMLQQRQARARRATPMVNAYTRPLSGRLSRDKIGADQRQSWTAVYSSFLVYIWHLLRHRSREQLRH
jgi:hypothetical protein